MVITAIIMSIIRHPNIMAMIHPITEIVTTTTMTITIMTIETNGVGIISTSIADDDPLDDHRAVTMSMTISMVTTMIMPMT